MSIESRAQVESARSRLTHENTRLRHHGNRTYDTLRRLENAVREHAEGHCGCRTAQECVLSLARRVPKNARPTRREIAKGQAFQEVGTLHGLVPFQARVLLGLADRSDGTASTYEIAGDLRVHESSIRRASGPLRTHGFIAVTAVDGLAPRRGVRNRLTLTEGGKICARLIRAALQEAVAE